MRGLSEVPRYLIVERGYLTTSLATDNPLDPARRAEAKKLRERTDAALDNVLNMRKTIVRGFHDAEAVNRDIDLLKNRYLALQQQMDSSYTLGKEERRLAARKIIAENAAFNGEVRRVMDEQSRRLAPLDGNAYRAGGPAYFGGAACHGPRADADGARARNAHALAHGRYDARQGQGSS
jgi:methyl-accepting chemotaxis protein